MSKFNKILNFERLRSDLLAVISISYGVSLCLAPKRSSRRNLGGVRLPVTSRARYSIDQIFSKHMEFLLWILDLVNAVPINAIIMFTLVYKWPGDFAEAIQSYHNI